MTKRIVKLTEDDLQRLVKNVVEEVIENDEKWMKMSTCSINKSKEYSIECIGAKWLDLFYSLLNNKVT